MARLKKIDKIALEKELYKRSFYEFFKSAWHVVEPGVPYVDNFHIKVICDHLQAVAEGKRLPDDELLNRLIINVPPGHAKTLTCCVMFPTWVWTQWPSKKILLVGYNARIVTQAHEKSRILIESSWYQERWSDVFQPQAESWSKTKLKNDKMGERHSDSIYGSITGLHFDLIIVDDPLKAQDVLGSAADLRTQLSKCQEVFDAQLSNRLTDPEKSAIVVIMQRLHSSDLAGVLLHRPEWQQVILPAYYREGQYTTNKLGRYDPRTHEGEVLWPTRFPKEELEKRRLALGNATHFSCQYQQTPIADGGNLFRSEDIRYYTELPEKKGSMIMSIDTAFGMSDTSDFTVIQVWMRCDADYYLIDQVRERYDFTQAVEAISKLSRKYPRALPIYVELTANGPAIVESLKKLGISGVKGEKTPRQNKYSRANAISPLFSAGNVYFPDPNRTSWVFGLVEELVSFPKSRHDDQVDALTQALSKLHKRDMAQLASNIANFIRRRV